MRIVLVWVRKVQGPAATERALGVSGGGTCESRCERLYMDSVSQVGLVALKSDLWVSCGTELRDFIRFVCVVEVVVSWFLALAGKCGLVGGAQLLCLHM